MWRAVELLRGAPAGGHVRARWDADKDAFTWHARHLRDGGPPQPRRDGAVSAARRLASLERDPADGRRAAGVRRPAGHGRVPDDRRGVRRPGHRRRAGPRRRHGRRRVLRPRITVETDDEVLAGRGAVLTSPARPTRRPASSPSPPAGDRTAVVARAQGGMGRAAHARARQRARRSARPSATPPSATASSGRPASRPGGHPVDARRPAAAVRPVRRRRPGGLVMTRAPPNSPSRATAEILADLGRGHRGVVVDSPPGAGKSTLVVRAAAGARRRRRERHGRRADQRAGRRPHRPAGRRPPAAADRPPRRERLHPFGTRGQAPARDASPRSAADLAGCPVVLSTAHKWAMVTRTRPGRGRSWTRPTRCARTCCCGSPACSTAPCSSATPASSTRSRPCRPTAGPA